jgi:hypothetical protein
MRHRLAAFLRRLGRACFAMADRVQPDPITKALDIAYAPPADEARAWSDREIADELREIRGTLKPWHPEKLTAFQRRQRAQR